MQDDRCRPANVLEVLLSIHPVKIVLLVTKLEKRKGIFALTSTYRDTWRYNGLELNRVSFAAFETQERSRRRRE